MDLSLMNFFRYTRPDCVGNDPADYRLFLLSSLRHIGRSPIFDGIEEHTFVSAKVRRNFLCDFLEYGSSMLCKKHATSPAKSVNFTSMGKFDTNHV